MLAQEIDDPSIWHGEELNAKPGWRFKLSADEVADLQEMAEGLRHKLQGDPNALLALETNDFALGTFGTTLERVVQTLKSGVGLAQIKGLPVWDMDLLDVATIYWGIGRHLGRATPNNPEGDMFGHITDLGKTQKDANSRGYQTRELMDYHCDQSDIVGLLCLRAAKSGGVSMLASSTAMYNRLLGENPEMAEALTHPLCWTKHGEFAEGEAPFYQSPVFNFQEGRLSTSFGPKHIEKGHKLEGTHPLSDLQVAALRRAEEIAHENRFEMVLEPGDMQFANNYVVLHTRSAYEDHDDPSQKRLLWRLWLTVDGLRHRTGYSHQWQSGVSLGASHHQVRI